MTTRLVEVRTKILKQNDVVARALRRDFQDAGVCAVSLVSSPGSGKTAFLEATLRLLRNDYRVAAVVGDLATDNDARRLARAEVPIQQITTGTVCHLEAEMVQSALTQWNLAELDFLFIENVGNLVCPSAYDLGEQLRAVLFSVTEGEDKPLKYPTIFNTADVAIITKMDLADAVEFDRAAARKNIQAVRPGMQILETSAKTGAGMGQWLELLQLRAARNSARRNCKNLSLTLYKLRGCHEHQRQVTLARPNFALLHSHGPLGCFRAYRRGKHERPVERTDASAGRFGSSVRDDRRRPVGRTARRQSHLACAPGVSHRHGPGRSAGNDGHCIAAG